jgi:hypothetical protein
LPAIPCKRLEEPLTTVIDDAILDAINKQPFSYIRELAKLTYFPITAIHWHLTRLLGFVVKHFRWISHSLTAYSLKEIIARAPFNQTSRMAVHYHP